MPDTMPEMKTNTLVLVCLTALTFTAIGQTNAPVPIPGATDAVPDVALSKLLLAVIVPVVVMLGKTLVKLPKASIPVIAIALGALADYIGALLGAWQGAWIVGAVLGAAGIGVRQVGHELSNLYSGTASPNNPS